MGAVNKRGKRQLTGVPILERALGLLEFLSRCPQGVALSQIARALSMPKNTAYRVLNTLCAHGYVSRNEADRKSTRLNSSH